MIVDSVNSEFGSELCQYSNQDDMPILKLIKGSNSGASIFQLPGVSYRWPGLRAHQETCWNTLDGVVTWLSFCSFVVSVVST